MDYLRNLELFSSIELCTSTAKEKGFCQKSKTCQPKRDACFKGFLPPFDNMLPEKVCCKRVVLLLLLLLPCPASTCCGGGKSSS